MISQSHSQEVLSLTLEFFSQAHQSLSTSLRSNLIPVVSSFAQALSLYYVSLADNMTLAVTSDFTGLLSISWSTPQTATLLSLSFITLSQLSIYMFNGIFSLYMNGRVSLVNAIRM